MVLAPGFGPGEVAIGAVLALMRGSVLEGACPFPFPLPVALFARIRLLIRAALNVAAHILRNLMREICQVSTLEENTCEKTEPLPL